MQESPNELILRLPFTLSNKDELDEEELDKISAGGYGHDLVDTIKSDAGSIANMVTVGNWSAVCASTR